jgi:hypothetical protein
VANMTDTEYRVVPRPDGSASVETSQAGGAAVSTRNFPSLRAAYSWIDQDKERSLTPPRSWWWPFRSYRKGRD